MEIFSHGSKVLKETKGILSLSDQYKFGPGGIPIKEECNCEEIRVFLVKYDLLGFREVPQSRRRITLDKNIKLEDIHTKISNIRKDDIITDENFYRYEQADLDKPLYKFSNNCNISLSVLSKDSWIPWETK